jgi:hypothetical protein
MPRITLNREVRGRKVVIDHLEGGDLFRDEKFPGVVFMKLKHSTNGSMTLTGTESGKEHVWCVGYEVIELEGTLTTKDV